MLKNPILKTVTEAFLVFALVLVGASASGQSSPVYAWRNFVGQPGSSGTNDGTGNAARFNNPFGLAVDSAGNVYVADGNNDTIRKVTSSGVVTTLAGLPGASGTNDGTGSTARFAEPEGVAVDSAGNVYVADCNNSAIRKVTSDGLVTTLAAAGFAEPAGVALDTAGNLYVADGYNCTIRGMTSGGVVTTLAGLAQVSGTNDGTGSAARFNFPWGVAVDSTGNVYVADRKNHTIRKVTSEGVVTTLAGLGGTSGTNDGVGSAARFNNPYGVAVDSAGNVYVADGFNSTIRRVTSTGVVTTIGGTAGVRGRADGIGSAALFDVPHGITMDSAGCLYVSDAGNYRLSKGTPLLPTLNVTRSGAGVVVSWPSAATGFVLQQNSDLGNASGWQTSGYSISDDGVTKSITVTAAAGRLFFRLAQ